MPPPPGGQKPGATAGPSPSRPPSPTQGSPPSWHRRPTSRTGLAQATVLSPHQALDTSLAASGADCTPAPHSSSLCWAGSSPTHIRAAAQLKARGAPRGLAAVLRLCHDDTWACRPLCLLTSCKMGSMSKVLVCLVYNFSPKPCRGPDAQVTLPLHWADGVARESLHKTTCTVSIF